MEAFIEQHFHFVYRGSVMPASDPHHARFTSYGTTRLYLGVQILSELHLRWSDGAPGRIRTCGLLLRRQTLYPLSYGGAR